MVRTTTLATLLGVALAASSAGAAGQSAGVTFQAEGKATHIEGEVARGAPRPGADLAAQGAGLEPLVIRKRVDKSSPLIAKALCSNDVIERLPVVIGGQRYELQNARCKCSTAGAIEEITIVHQGFKVVK